MWILICYWHRAFPFFRRTHFVSKEQFPGNNLLGREKSLSSLFHSNKNAAHDFVLWTMAQPWTQFHFIPSPKALLLSVPPQSSLSHPPLIILLLELNWSLMVQYFKISSKPGAGRASLPKLIPNLKVLRVELCLVAFNYLQPCWKQSSHFSVCVVQIVCILFT